tara:strand:- start:1002 stop:1262 length:261 start_codon:yes stop_codon:yes gene_type:complete
MYSAISIKIKLLKDKQKTNKRHLFLVNLIVRLLSRVTTTYDYARLIHCSRQFNYSHQSYDEYVPQKASITTLTNQENEEEVVLSYV